MMLIAYFIIFSHTVDFILVNECKHDPVTDKGTLEETQHVTQMSFQGAIVIKKNAVITHNSN